MAAVAATSRSRHASSAVNGERRSFALLRPIVDTDGAGRVRERSCCRRMPSYRGTRRPARPLRSRIETGPGRRQRGGVRVTGRAEPKDTGSVQGPTMLEATKLFAQADGESSMRGSDNPNPFEERHYTIAELG